MCWGVSYRADRCGCCPQAERDAYKSAIPHRHASLALDPTQRLSHWDATGSTRATVVLHSSANRALPAAEDYKSSKTPRTI